VSELDFPVGDMPSAEFGPAREIVTSIYELSPLVLEELAQWLEMRGLRTTVSQVTGLKGFNTISYTEVNADVVIAAGTTVTVLSTTVALGGQNAVEIRADFPQIDFTDTAGGSAQVQLVVGASTYVLGAMHTDRSLGWPASFLRRSPIVSVGSVAVSLRVQSTGGNLTARASAGYGPLTLEIAAQYPGS
jgi:hypothetical protein